MKFFIKKKIVHLKDKHSIIVIEEELILSPDFLYFFSQVYDVYINDPTVSAISAWNPNCEIIFLRHLP